MEHKNKELICHKIIIKKYEGCFTVGQNHSIKTGKRPKQWVDEDVSWAMTLYMASSRAYNLVRTTMPLVLVIWDLLIKLRRLLGVTQEFPCIITPNGNNMTFFADVPHLLKIVQGHFLHYGFQYGKEIITADAVRVLHSIQEKSELKYAPKLRAEHLQVKEPRAQKVKLAAQLISNKVASAIRELCTTDAFKGLMPAKLLVSAEFIDKFDQWFDLFNVPRAHMDSRPTRRAFGINIVG